MTWALQLGDTLPPVSRHFTLDVLRYRYRPGSDYSNLMPTQNIHSDAEAAAAEGLAAPVAAAPSVMSLVFHQMTLYFGEGWFSGGKATLTATKPVYAGDFVTAKAKLVREELDGDRVRRVFSVAVENQKGVKVVIGEASGLMPQ